MSHWQYILCGLGGPAGFAAAWRYMPRAFLMLVGGLTRNPQRSRQCAEMIRLARKDAKDITSYLADVPEGAKLPASRPSAAEHRRRRNGRDYPQKGALDQAAS